MDAKMVAKHSCLIESQIHCTLLTGCLFAVAITFIAHYTCHCVRYKEPSFIFTPCFIYRIVCGKSSRICSVMRRGCLTSKIVAVCDLTLLLLLSNVKQNNPFRVKISFSSASCQLLSLCFNLFRTLFRLC